MFVIAMALFILFGGGLRFKNLERKFPWMDECITQVRVSDYSDSIAVGFPDAITSPISVASLQTHLEEKPQQSLAQLIDVKLSHIPEHPPLYYLLGAKAASLFGNQFVVLRALSAGISLLAFPAMYWLCLELFGLPLHGAIGVGIVAICPLYLLYAQEAREYSLWIVAGMLSSAALLRSLRTNRRLDWLIYSLTLVLGLYTHLFFAFNIFAHILGNALSMVKDRAHFATRWSIFVMTIGLSSLAFAPWGLLFFRGASRIEQHAQWFTGSFDIRTVAIRIVGSVVRTIYDVGFSDPSSLDMSFGTIVDVLPLLLALMAIGASLISILKMPNWPAKCHIISLLIVPLALTIVGESLTGKVLTQTRYLMPVWLGIQLALVYFTKQLLTQFKSPFVLSLISKTVVALVIVGSCISCFQIIQAEFWWSKGSTKELSIMAESVEANRSLLVTDINHLPSITRLAYQLSPQTKLQFTSSISRTPSEEIEHTYYLVGVEDALLARVPETDRTQILSLTAEDFTLYEAK